jgi:hypothetical protein
VEVQLDIVAATYESNDLLSYQASRIIAQVLSQLLCVSLKGEIFFQFDEERHRHPELLTKHRNALSRTNHVLAHIASTTTKDFIVDRQDKIAHPCL